MRLTRIELENFKGIRARQVIDLAPITLLFGANSAGKSSILQALHYAREILENGNADPDRTIAGGDMDLGGFVSLVHGKDLSKAISVKLEIELDPELGSPHLPINQGVDSDEFEELSILYSADAGFGAGRHVRAVTIELTTRWSAQANSAYVSRIAVGMNGEHVVAISAPGPGRGSAEAHEFNFLHPLLMFYERPETVHDDFETLPEPNATTIQVRVLDEEVVEDSVLYDETSIGDLDFSPLAEWIAHTSKIMQVERARSDSPPSESRIGVYTSGGALPPIEQIKFAFGVEDALEYDAPVDPNDVAMAERVQSLLNELVGGPIRIARDFLRTVTFLGPLRQIPDRGFRARASKSADRWANGLAAWDELCTSDDEAFVDRVNSWLSGELAGPCSIELREVTEVSDGSRLAALFGRSLTPDDLGELERSFEELPRYRRVQLRDTRSNALLEPHDVGVGISQVIPVVVGCLRRGEGLFAIEQPELHIHPGMQVGLGDLFLRTVERDGGDGLPTKSLLIETHSEHIMLRLLRRVRETNDKALPPGAPAARPDDISVVYVDVEDDAVRFLRQRVTEDGDFAGRWPRGFFRERAGELL